MTKVGLLADRLGRARTTGVGTYVKGLVQGFDNLASDHELVLFSQDGSSLRKLSWSVFGAPAIRPPRGDLDLLHVLVPTMPVPTALPLVVTVHDLMPMKHPHWFSPRARWLFGRAMRQFQRQAVHFIAVSEATGADVEAVLEIPRERITIIPEGEPLDLTAPDAAAIEPALQTVALHAHDYVLFLGELATRKNPLWLVESFAQVASRHPTLRLVFAGSPGIGAAAVRARVEALGLESRVAFLGHVPRDLVGPLLAGASAVVLPSEDEGFGIPAVEAMTCGAPLIVSDRGALPEVVGDGGEVVPFADVGALADALYRTATDAQARTDLAARGKRRARAFSWRRAAQQTIDVYSHVAHG